MIAPVNGIDAHVLKEVVHPPHVPFEPEPEPAEISRTRYTGPRRRFLGDSDDPGEMLITNLVEPLEKINGIEVFAAAVKVRDPLPWLTRVIEVKHRRDCIHAQAVDVIFIEPEKRVT